MSRLVLMPCVFALASLTFPAHAGGSGATLLVPGDHPDIQAALDAALPGDTVLVGDGVWTGAGNRNLDFAGKDIVLRSLSGPQDCILDCQGTPERPQRVFVFDDDESRAARVEGFTITGGATLPGAIADPFNGGAVQILGASPTFARCHFVGNTCGCWGAAVYAAHGGAPLIENCLFLDNVAGDDGGALFSWAGTSAEIRNSVFMNNGAATSGGALAIFGGGHTVIESATFVGNYAPQGSAIMAYDTSITNSLIWGKQPGPSQLVYNFSSTLDITWSNVEGGYAGTGNTNVEPRLRNGYHLNWDSPLIDAGDPAFVPLAGTRDIDGEARVFFGRIDMGADELGPFVTGKQ